MEATGEESVHHILSKFIDIISIIISLSENNANIDTKSLLI